MCVLVLVWRSPQRSLEDRARDCHRIAQCKSHEAQRRLWGGKIISFDCVVYTLSVLSETSVLIYLWAVPDPVPIVLVLHLLAHCLPIFCESNYSKLIWISATVPRVNSYYYRYVIYYQRKREYMCVTQLTCGEERTALWSHFPPSFLGTALQACTVSTFTCQPISPARVDWTLPLRFP